MRLPIYRYCLGMAGGKQINNKMRRKRTVSVPCIMKSGLLIPFMCNNNNNNSNTLMIITAAIIMIISFMSTPYLILVEAQNTSGTSVHHEVNVGLVFDELEGKEGESVSCAIEIALSDFYASHRHYKTRLVVHKWDSHDDVVGAAAAALELIKNVQVEAILGPKTSMQASFVIELGEKAQVPIITFSASSPSLTSDRKPFFFQANQKDSTQVNVVSAIVQAFGWREVVAIYIDNDFGRGILPYLNDALQAVDARIAYRSPIPPEASDEAIIGELYKLKTMQTRVFIIHMSPALGSRLFLKAQEAGMVDKGYVWIMTSGITDSLHGISSSVFGLMQGALGVRAHVPVTKKLQDFKARWMVKMHQENPHILHPVLDVIALWAHDASVALAMAVEQAGTGYLAFDHRKANHNGSNSSRCPSSSEIKPISVSNNGRNLIRTLSEISFTGLAENFFRFVDGQLPDSVYQVVNIHRDGARGVGFWTQESSLVRNLNTTYISFYRNRVPSSPSSLAPIIWAGESNSVPKGWEIPTSGNKLKVGVPVKQGFLEFVNVSINPTTNDYVVSGYSIDVFKAVIEALPYPVDYEFLPFAKPNSIDPAGTYDDLVDQVYQGNYGAVVGDVDIRYSRTLHVDFTSYMPSTVEMVVPVRDTGAKKAWVFLKPLTWQLWLTIAISFLWIGFVVWFLERKVNEEFVGPTLQQVSIGFWYSFSTMVFAHKEKVVSNLTKMVVIVWCFVVLILSQSYTASLASLLTVQQLQPTVSKLGDLLQSRENVGYEQGSYMKGFLKGLGFQDSNLVMFKSAEDLRRLFQLGSRNGGVAAVFDDASTMKLFMTQYCNEYTIVDPTFQTDGYGFVFPKGSPLVSDISRAILELKEKGTMRQIEDKWFGKEKDCSDSNTSITSTALGVDSFLGLFIIAGVASTFALVVSLSLSVRRREQDQSDDALVDAGGTNSPSASTNSVDSGLLERDIPILAGPNSNVQLTRRFSH